MSLLDDRGAGVLVCCSTLVILLTDTFHQAVEASLLAADSGQVQHRSSILSDLEAHHHILVSRGFESLVEGRVHLGVLDDLGLFLDRKSVV